MTRRSRSRWVRAVLHLCVGGLLGGLLGYFQQCAGGTCPLMCVWWRGALFGAVAGLLIWASGSRATPPDASRQQEERTKGP